MAFELGVKTLGDVGADGAVGAVDYLPFGVKTLKVQVSGDHEGKVRLRPLRLSPTAGEKFGHEDGPKHGRPNHGPPNHGAPIHEQPNFVISWGGGHEDYYELDYPKKRFAYFLVHHVGQPVEDAVLTIQATDVESDETVDLPVLLTFPAAGGPWDPADLIQPNWLQIRAGLDGEADLRLEGLFTPDYIPRWWPQGRVSYAFRNNTPRVRLHFQRRVDETNGRLTLFLARPGALAERSVATVEGSIAYPLYDMQQVTAELYRFGSQTWVLRLWFFWLDLEISRQDLSRHWLQEPADVEEAWKGVTARAQGGMAEAAWHERHEIPDAERVDILFDNDLRPLYAATDLHWREMWGQFAPEQPDDLLQARIMNTKATALLKDWEESWQVIKGWGTIILSNFAKNKPPYKPHEEVKAELAGQGKLAADPIALQSHSPTFMNLEVQRRFTSTDVTDG